MMNGYQNGPNISQQQHQQFTPPVASHQQQMNSGFVPLAKPIPGMPQIPSSQLQQNHPSPQHQLTPGIPSLPQQQTPTGGLSQTGSVLNDSQGSMMAPPMSSYQQSSHSGYHQTGLPPVSSSAVHTPQMAAVQPQMAAPHQRNEQSFTYSQANGPQQQQMSQAPQVAQPRQFPHPPANHPGLPPIPQQQGPSPVMSQHQGHFGMTPGSSVQQHHHSPTVSMSGRPGIPPVPQTGPQQPPGLPPMPQSTQPHQQAHPGLPPMPQQGGVPPQPQMQTAGGPPGMPPMGGPPQMPPSHAPGMGQAGPPQQPQRRLDPNLMPSAIQVMQDDAKSKGGVFQTGYPIAEVPPLVSTDFYTEDQGNCNPKFMRSTMYCAPASSDLLKTSAMPFGVSICPFARQDSREYPPPVMNLGDLGPVRCHRCKAYMCPFMEFQDGGRRFRCPFCKSSSEVPTEYFAHLDHQGRRTDLYERPELYLGSVEFVATKEYCKNGVLPNAPAFIFMLDVSYNSVRSGVVQLFCENIKHILEDLPKELGMEESVMKVGFATYDQSVHFYNLKNSLDQPQMMIVGDIQDMFVPMVDGFLVSPKEAEAAIHSLLQEIPNMFSDSRITEIILGPVIQAGMDALKAADRAGKLFLFHSSLPILEAPGKLKNRDDRKLLGTEKEKTVLSPQDDFYSKLAQDCVAVGCCVDVFLFPNSYVDVATIGNMCGITGGQIYKYQYFEVENDGRRFLEDLHHDVERPIAFDAMMRVRTSTGIRPTDFFGNIYMSNTTDVELAAMDSDKCVTIEIRHDDKLEDSAAYIQAAMLFTSVSGQRRLRIHNVALPVAENHLNMYRLADLDTTVNFIAKHAGRLLMQKQPKDVKEYLIGRTAQILATYRERCSEQAPAGQLILPECMKLLPLYTGCILKNDAFFGGSDLTTDDRAWLLQSAPSLRVIDSVYFFYPRMLPVRDLPPEAADSDNFEMPCAVRCLYENLCSDGVYLLENGILMFLWIGLNTPSDWVQDAFGCSNVTQINVEKHELPEKDNSTSRALRRIVKRIQRPRPRMMKLYIISQQSKLEPWMKKFLVEDRGADNSPSYVDFLCHIHREIRNILS